jgi:hypothetical protein
MDERRREQLRAADRRRYWKHRERRLAYTRAYQKAHYTTEGARLKAAKRRADGAAVLRDWLRSERGQELRRQLERSDSLASAWERHDAWLDSLDGCADC